MNRIIPLANSLRGGAVRYLRLVKRTSKQIFDVNWIKTLYFNFVYFSFPIAVRLPVFIYRRTILLQMNGEIIIDNPISPGIVKIGPYCVGIHDSYYSRTIWQCAGKLVIRGKTSIGRGTKISIGDKGTLTLGEHFSITGKSEIICQKDISFGNDCLLSWDILLMDTDFHKILNERGEIINCAKPISIGDHVWIGCRNTILKGVAIGNNNIISANSTITKSFKEENSIIGGHGSSCSIIKRNVEWAR